MKILSNMKILSITVLVAGTMLATFTPVVAETITGQMNVSASVGQACTLSATPMAFGALTDVSATATTTITLTCSGAGTLATVAVGGGQNQSADTPFRQLRSGAGDLIPWTMMLTPATAIIAADAAVTLVPSISQNNSFSVTLVAEIAASVDYPAGMYVDVVTLTTEYAFP
jgi:hypothetical protein